MSAILDLVLGIITSIGGFVEAGSISTAAAAGSEFGFQLLWAIAAATVMLAMLIEMSGRLAAVSGQSMAAAVRERFGIHFHAIPLTAELLIDLLLLAAEIGGVAIAVKLLTGIGFQWWVVPIGIAGWLVLWSFGFGLIEYGVGLLGLVTLSFVVAAWQLQPDTSSLAASLVPSMPTHDFVRYAFLSVSILGATVSPYLLNFYSSGAVEEQMTERQLWVNRATAYAGICFGGVVSMGALVTSALVLGPRGAILGYTIGNDVSSRAIEGANPLYLAQAKVYAAACAIGPAVYVPAGTPEAFAITMRITGEDGDVVYEDTTSTAKMVRSFEELASWLVRDNPIAPGTVLLTGTGLVPPDEVSLQPGQTVEIRVPEIGTLSNPVVLASTLV